VGRDHLGSAQVGREQRDAAKWIRQAEVDDGQRPGTTSDESAELKRLRRENAELRRANEILRATYFAKENVLPK
jgi:transposase-like protein